MGVNIHDVAARAGVSIKTVSRVMNAEPNVREETRRRVAEAIADLDYVPNVGARRMAGDRSYLIGMFFHARLGFYVNGLQLGAARKCRDRDFLLAVEPIDEGQEAIVDLIARTTRRSRLDGVILVPPLCNDVEILSAIEALHVPIVRISPRAELERTARVFVDERRGAYEGVQHLIELGHRDIAMVLGPNEAPASRLREEGFRDAMGAAGLEIRPSWLVQGDFYFRSGVQCGEALLARKDRPTAIFSASDVMALGVMAAASRLGVSIPGDVSLVGFDDHPSASTVWPRLTTVRQPVEAMGGIAAEILLALRSSSVPSPETQRRFDLEVIVRESTAPPS